MCRELCWSEKVKYALAFLLKRHCQAKQSSACEHVASGMRDKSAQLDFTLTNIATGTIRNDVMIGGWDLSRLFTILNEFRLY